MRFPALSAIVARSMNVSSVDGTTDGELLRRFVRTRDEPAFAVLVRRLGPMVLGVCRRVSNDRHLAEDAFQATFAVLARRAADVRPAGAVRAWLFGVAVRTARGVRAVSAHRLAREVPMAAVPDRAAEAVVMLDADVLCALDLEIAALPEHLRAAVVLCELLRALCPAGWPRRESSWPEACGGAGFRSRRQDWPCSQSPLMFRPDSSRKPPRSQQPRRHCLPRWLLYRTE
jgi:DNA-directed RNA polymerase specialized sigma24 family protein